MGRHNQVNLYGILVKDPKIEYRTNVKGETVYNYAKILLYTAIGARQYSSHFKQPEDHVIPVIVKNSQLVEQIEKEKWKKYNIIQIKGVLTTQNVIKKSKCPHCNAIMEYKGGQITYVTPSNLVRVLDTIDSESSIQHIRRNIEISNTIQVVGTLCSDPKNYRKDKDNGEWSIEYQIAINRKYYIKENDPSEKTDYPYVRSYGEQAELDKKLLKQSSSVLIDGFLKARGVRRTSVCENCQEEYEWNDTSAVEIVPYSVEYLKDCNEVTDTDGDSFVEEFFSKIRL